MECPSYNVCFVQIFVTHYPRLVFLLFALVNLAVITCAFTVYHLMLAITNQTVNERYKYYYMSRSTTATSYNNNFYHRGILLNLFESFFPLQHAKYCCSRKIT